MYKAFLGTPPMIPMLDFSESSSFKAQKSSLSIVSVATLTEIRIKRECLSSSLFSVFGDYFLSDSFS